MDRIRGKGKEGRDRVSKANVVVLERGVEGGREGGKKSPG